MFELKVITKYKKESESNDSQNYHLHQVIEGQTKLFRISSETFALTDKFEFFRFLPTRRTNTIFIIAIPSNCTEENFISLLGSSIQKIQSIIFIRNPITKFLQVIIHFNSQDSADNFYYNFNTKHFPQNKSEFLYCAFVVDVTYSETDSLPLSDSSSEMFTCPLCIEKIETRCSGIETVINLFPCERWVNYKNHCSVCSLLHNQNPNKRKCGNCEKENDSWCCLVCGYIGCSRYQNKHAVDHYKTSLHRYSIELNSQRIWDYMTDTWIHRLIKNEDNTTAIVFDEAIEERPTSKEFLMRMENVIEEYNEVVGSQLEVQRNFYEKEVDRMKEKYDSMAKEMIGKMESIKEELTKKETKTLANEKLHKECFKKINQQNKKIDELKEAISFNKICIEELRTNNMKANQNVIKLPISKEKLQLLESKRKRREQLQKELEDAYSQL